MSTILGANSVSGSYEIDNSLRFADNAKLTKTLDSAGNRKTYTLSTWIKRSHLDEPFVPFYNYSSDSAFFAFLIHHSSDKLLLYQAEGGTDYGYQTDIVFRDPSAWYHIVLAVDTTQSTAANRVILYVNGSEVTFNQNYGEFPQDFNTRVNDTSQHNIGHYQDSGVNRFTNGYIAECHFIEGSAKAPTDFAETDNNGVWIPKAYAGTYGDNGFYLEFKETGTSANSSGIGADTSGNDNHFAVSNIVATDVTTDTPTNNFMTLNPLAKAALAANPTEGNLIHKGQTSGYAQTVLGTLAWHGSGGKWYWEMEQGGATAGNYGFVRTDKPDGTNGVGNIVQTTSSQPAEVVAYDWAWGVNPSNGNSRHDGSNDSYGSALGNGDHGMVAVDTVAGKAWWGKNGTWFNSGNPATGANPAFTDSDMTEGIFTIYSMVSDTDGRIKRYNFGNPPTGFAIASGNADENGHGNFEYAPPSGYFALCTKNLGEFG